MNKNWTKEEVELLKIEYANKGLKKCLEIFNRSKSSLINKIRKLGFKRNKSIKYEKELFSSTLKKSTNFSDFARNLELKTTAGNIKTIKRYIVIYNLDISHFEKYKNDPTKLRNKRSLDNILTENSTYCFSSSLKKRLYNEGLKERLCEECGQDENWHNKKMSLVLDHINGINNDNRIENLRILCPNCNATMDTFCRGNRMILKNQEEYKLKQKIRCKDECACGILKEKRAPFCYKCSKIKKRKIENRPDLNTLLLDVNKIGYSATGRKYGVSDNSIRKWIKYYIKLQK